MGCIRGPTLLFLDLNICIVCGTVGTPSIAWSLLWWIVTLLVCINAWDPLALRPVGAATVESANIVYICIQVCRKFKMIDSVLKRRDRMHSYLCDRGRANIIAL